MSTSIIIPLAEGTKNLEESDSWTFNEKTPLSSFESLGRDTNLITTPLNLTFPKNLGKPNAKQQQVFVPPPKNILAFINRNHFSQSQNWIGYVIEINKETFRAKVEDAYESSGTYEEVEFDLMDVEDEDKELLSIGSVFYWSIGYEYRKGTKSKQSMLRFKRLPKWNTTDIDSAKDLADDLYKNLNWD